MAGLHKRANEKSGETKVVRKLPVRNVYLIWQCEQDDYAMTQQGSMKEWESLVRPLGLTTCGCGIVWLESEMPMDH